LKPDRTIVAANLKLLDTFGLTRKKSSARAVGIF
jgi:hypothetical protein